MQNKKYPPQSMPAMVQEFFLLLAVCNTVIVARHPHRYRRVPYLTIRIRADRKLFAPDPNPYHNIPLGYVSMI